TLVARLGARIAVRNAFEECVRVGVEPHRLSHSCGPGWFGHRWYLLGAAPPVAEHVQAAVGGDAVQPGAERGSFFEAAQAAPGRDERLLHDVLGILERPEKPVAVHMELSSVGLDQLPKHGLVAGSRTAERSTAQVRVTRHRLPTTRITLADTGTAS